MKDYFRHPSKGWGWWDTSERPSPVLMLRLPVGCSVQVGAPVYAISEAEATEIKRLRRELDAERCHVLNLRHQIAYLEERDKQCREWHEWAGRLLYLSDIDTRALTASYKRQRVGELIANLRSMALRGVI